ncbi:DUF5313 family protein [Kutzneria kofuensis]|uniref:DUF5313 domain-containing protein n=1 Tax=Kutzneria kofuensis TaxID=103725 RepID=A0A7W9NIU8_9PSEU|nr:DUF5313 family protein [Kutzneria kofuensis]MBB5893949.1 hypothetical protein [Kutzneria kofuensis]
MAVKRPNPALWLWYSFGGRLPQDYREWVLGDVISKTWLLRHLLRTFLRLLIPLAILFIVLSQFGGPLYIILMALALGLIVGLYYSLSYASEANDARLRKYGYPPAYGSTIRDNRFSEEDRPE